jgi:hypothetical protein
MTIYGKISVNERLVQISVPGRVMVKAAPWPSALSTPIWPP